MAPNARRNGTATRKTHHHQTARLRKWTILPCLRGPSSVLAPASPQGPNPAARPRRWPFERQRAAWWNVRSRCKERGLNGGRGEKIHSHNSRQHHANLAEDDMEGGPRVRAMGGRPLVTEQPGTGRRRLLVVRITGSAIKRQGFTEMAKPSDQGHAELLLANGRLKNPGRLTSLPAVCLIVGGVAKCRNKRRRQRSSRIARHESPCE
jgi:hypothetical protein